MADTIPNGCWLVYPCYQKWWWQWCMHSVLCKQGLPCNYSRQVKRPTVLIKFQFIWITINNLLTWQYWLALTIQLFRDNVAGGLNGPETVTFQDPAINSLYTYLVAIDDWEWENNGDDFFNSGSSITVLNQIQSHDAIMVGSNGTATETFYFFGCVNILPSKFSNNSQN